MFNMYVDESSQNSHEYMVLGGAVVRTSRADEISDALRNVKAKYNLQSKIRWTDLSRHKLNAYEEFFDVFRGYMREQKACFHTLVVNCSKVDNSLYNNGDNELGFSKFIYQLLLHKFARKYERPPLHAFLDSRTTNQSLEEVREMINSALQRDYNIRDRPLRVLQFQSPLQQPLLEATDLIIGATAYHKNRRDKAPDASAHKKALSFHIARSFGVSRLGGDTAYSATTYTVWNFNFNKKKRSHGPR